MGTIQDKLTYLLRTQGMIRIAINNKGGKVTADDTFRSYAQAIINLPVGTAGEFEIPTVTGNCQYRFSNNGWNWLIDDYGSRIETADITDTMSMFYNSDELEFIPFEINFKAGSAPKIGWTFRNCKALKEIPVINASPSATVSGTAFEQLFNGCENIRTIPTDFFWKIGSEEYWTNQQTKTATRTNIFPSCYSLRQIPDISMLGNAQTSSYSSLYYYMFDSCYVLDEIVDFPIVTATATATANMFNTTFRNCWRLKRLTFVMNEDGTPKTANWKNQVIDLTTVGHFQWTTSNENKIIGYNSGITVDKDVYDDATYQALKDDPDWYSSGADGWYSRYDKFSAIETINSLPDTSAAGGTNTIKFVKDAGMYKVQTDVQAESAHMYALTEEEIAVATAKGWTVSFV